MFSKWEKALLAIGWLAIVAPFTYGMTKAQGWQGFLLALIIITVIGFSAFALLQGPHPTSDGK